MAPKDGDAEWGPEQEKDWLEMQAKREKDKRATRDNGVIRFGFLISGSFC